MYILGMSIILCIPWEVLATQKRQSFGIIVLCG